MNILVSHPTGNANVRAVLEALDAHRMLDEYVTTIAVSPSSKWLKALPGSVRKELLRRSYSLHSDKIHRIPFREIGRLGFQKIGFKNFIRPENGSFSIDAVYRKLDKAVSRRIEKKRFSTKIDAVYSYEDGAYSTFLTAAKLNIFRIYDLPIGYWRAERDLLGKERDKRPQWAMTLTGFRDSDDKLQRKDHEIEIAQHIIVASSFTKETLSCYPGVLPPVSVIPYGFPQVVNNRTYNFDGRRKLRLLFVGGLSQRKGIAQILEAVSALQNRVELTLVGRKASENCKPLNEALQKYRYISSLSHNDVLDEMRNNDILLFPSLFEGFGLVVTESMSQGTPVITTNRTCGTDLIEHGKNGWIIDPDASNAITNQLKKILENPRIIEKVGNAARETARARPWSQYRKELVEELLKINKKRIDSQEAK